MIVLKLSLVSGRRTFFGRGNEIHYIGGTEILPAPLDTAEEQKMIHMLGTVNEETARSMLIERNLRLVVYIAKKFDNTGIGVEDLISIGTIGLIKAINTFNPGKNIKLATYASRCIENEILMYLRRNSKTKTEVSIDEPLNVDWEGNELLLSDILGTENDIITKDIENKVKIDEMRKEFLDNVSHELKTPLTSISGYAEIMMNGLVKSEDMQGFSERIYKEASRMITLVGDIIKLSKLDEGSVELEKENVDLYQMTREIVSRLALQAEKRRIQVEVVGEHVECFGIRQILDEMIYNICENAIKYNKEDGWVHVSLNADHQYFYLKVEDSGIGIPEDSLGHIYERFYRVDKSHSREIGGTGLGLAITRNAVLMHRGAIKVFSTEGEGTIFNVRIPLNYIS